MAALVDALNINPGNPCTVLSQASLWLVAAAGRHAACSCLWEARSCPPPCLMSTCAHLAPGAQDMARCFMSATKERQKFGWFMEATEQQKWVKKHDMCETGSPALALIVQ